MILICQVAGVPGSAARIPGPGQFTNLVNCPWLGVNSGVS